MAILHLTAVNDIVDGLFRPIASTLTVAQAAEWLQAADLPGYVEARFRVEPLAPVSVSAQLAGKVRRLKAIAKGCGRVVVRVEPVAGMTNQFRALLAR